MATTTNYGWTTPDDTALVKDGAAAIRTLGSSIDTSLNTALGTKKAGMVLLNTTSFSAVASQSVNDVFSSTYDNYRIVISYTSATGSATRIRWRVSGSDNTTTNYNYTGFRSNMADGTTGSWTQTADGNDFHFIGETTTSDISSSVLDVFTPFATAKTNYVFSAIRVGQFYGGAGYFNATTSFTGFTIYSASGNMTGSVSIYGYNK